jgi:predicted phage terminase large subunit-like protein
MHRRACRTDLLTWCTEALSPLSQKPARHHKLLISALQDIADGKNDRLLVCLPPGAAKSTYCSILFPPYLMARRPGLQVIGASHGSTLAEDFSKRVQTQVREHSDTLGFNLLNNAADRWNTSNGGFYRAAGTGGSITGRRADLAIWDDPLTAEQASSQTFRDSAWDWYTRELIPRLKPGAAIVLVMTRWHPDDPAGRLLEAAKAGGDQWRVLSLPAIAETHDELGRVPGEVLWPEWEDLAAINRKRRAVGEHAFAALFQQRPTVAEGAIIHRDWWTQRSAPPERPEMILLSLDTAYTAKEANDASACTVWNLVPGESTRSKLLMRYAWRERLEFNDLVTHVLNTAKQFGLKGVPMPVLIEAKASGLPLIQELRRRVPDMQIIAVQPKGDKIARAHAVTSLLQAGKVEAMAREGEFRPWAQMVIDECAAFPNGTHDDLVDSTTQALRWFRDSGVEFFAEDEGEPERMTPREALY